jgi:hypothetical protein
VREKPTVGSSFLGEFPSDRITKATKDVNVHNFIHNSNSCKSYASEYWELAEATEYQQHLQCFILIRIENLRIDAGYVKPHSHNICVLYRRHISDY